MSQVQDLLNSLNERRLQIVETGCANTKDITRWVSENPDSEFINVDLDFRLQVLVHTELEAENIARHCRFLTQDHCKYLSNRTWVDAVFLNPQDLQNGQMEFLLAISTGAKTIVMSDYQTRAALAIKRAKEIGWEYESAGSLNILRRPK
jgi:hypothetical protein